MIKTMMVPSTQTTTVSSGSRNVRPTSTNKELECGFRGEEITESLSADGDDEKVIMIIEDFPEYPPEDPGTRAFRILLVTGLLVGIAAAAAVIVALWMQIRQPKYNDDSSPMGGRPSLAPTSVLAPSFAVSDCDKSPYIFLQQDFNKWNVAVVQLRDLLAVYFDNYRHLGDEEESSSPRYCFPASEEQARAFDWMFVQFPQDLEQREELLLTIESASTAAAMGTTASVETSWLLQVYLASFLAVHWDISPNGMLPPGYSSTNSLVPSFVSQLCSWQGIGCTNEGRWISLQWNGGAGGMDLQGNIPTELGLLTNLALLDLSNNSGLTGTLPEMVFASLTNIQALYLEQNSALEGTLPHSFANMSRLTDLRVNMSPGIQKYGLPSPELLEQLWPLEFLEWTQEAAGDFDTTPTVIPNALPTQIGFLTNLKRLALDGNGLTGDIPTEIGLLTDLSLLDLSGNSFRSTVPFEIGRMTQLEWLSLQSCGLTGSLPTSLTELEELAFLELGSYGTGHANSFDPGTVYSVLQSLPLNCFCGEGLSHYAPSDVNAKLIPIPDVCYCSSVSWEDD